MPEGIETMHLLAYLTLDKESFKMLMLGQIKRLERLVWYSTANLLLYFTF